MIRLSYPLLQHVSVAVLACFLALNLQANTATEPVPRDPRSLPPDPKWMQRHEEFLQIAHSTPIDVLFIGDSITDFWRDEDKNRGGKAVWASHFAPLHAANFGIGADRTQHVLWRIQHGELDGIHPRAVVLLIGTNNLGLEKDRPIPRNSTSEAIEGITAVVHAIQAKLATTHILLFALFPRGEKSDPIRQQIQEVNQALARLDDHRSVTYLDVGSQFLLPDGTIAQRLMPDLLHPSEEGYKLWAESLKAPLETLLK